MCCFCALCYSLLLCYSLMFLCTLLQLAPLLQPAVSVQPASYSLLMLQTASVGTFGGNFQDDPQGLKLKHSRKVGVRVWGGRARGRGGLGLKVMGRGMHYSPPAPPPPSARVYPTP